MQRSSLERLEEIKNTMLGDKYIFDIPIYDILNNPTYAHSFEFYFEKIKNNKNH